MYSARCSQCIPDTHIFHVYSMYSYIYSMYISCTFLHAFRYILSYEYILQYIPNRFQGIHVHSYMYSMYILVHSRSGARMYLKCYHKYTSKYTIFPGHEGMYVKYTLLMCTQYTSKYTLSRTSQECMLNILDLLLQNILLNIPYSIVYSVRVSQEYTIKYTIFSGRQAMYVEYT